MDAWSDIAYDMADIVSVFGGPTVRRAQSYVKRITGVRDKQWPITARVEGTELYATTLDLDADDRLTSRCTCPVATLCEHAAALAIRLHTAEGQESREIDEAFGPTLARLDGKIGRWLDTLPPTGEPTIRRRRRTVEALYFLSEDRDQIVLEIRKARILRDGRMGKPTEVGDPRAFIAAERADELRLIERLLAFRGHGPSNYAARSIESYDAGLMNDLIDTGRLFWQSSRSPIVHGEPRSELPVWVRSGDEYRLEFPSGHRLLGAVDPLYLDTRRGLIGRLDLPLSRTDRNLLAAMPAVPATMFRSMQRGTTRLFGQPLEVFAAPVEETPGLDAVVLECEVVLHLARGRRFGGPTIDCEAWAVYGDRRFGLCAISEDDPPGRDILEESRRRKELHDLLVSVPTGYYDEPDSDRRRHISETVADRVIPRLRTSGWRAELGEGFTAAAPLTDVEWIEELAEIDGVDGPAPSWFSYSLGVEIDGKTYSLLPILVKALRDPNIDLNLAELARGGGDGFTINVDKETRIYVPRDRLVKWLRPLLEIELRGLGDDGRLRLAAPLALEVVGEDDRRGVAESAVAMRLRAQLQRLLELEPQPEPEGFVGELRHYQKQGLSWLSFLHDCGYGGVLADDMGLGKTIQVLALAQQLRNQGRLPAGHPILVVAPRSVAENWRREVARFTPGLSAYVHLGPKRTRAAADIRSEADIVITSYMTLLRDIAAFKEIEWTSVVLDEAQAIKNPKTKLRKAIISLRAISRLCVTGTPIENRLLELWSQIDVAMPGLFGPRAGFIRVFETPIKNGDVHALETLRRRLRPFMLRRTKGEVELALPEKTESIVPIALTGDQRDLYEGLRLALSDSVRDALADRGVGGSAMIVLDALLKLRQSCCDPRLVKTESARAVKESAKLERLLEMLDDLASTGRSVLVFSQFASMLELIEEACSKRDIATVKLTGKTRDRQRVIDAFQRGDVPVFLISLKAGGVGLNLTRADTVIHYDPWWNPAAEAQATDRAHRIGQTKPVFVYKLIASGTVEERVIALQDQKRAMTDAGLSNAGVSHLTAHDLVALFD